MIYFLTLFSFNNPFFKRLGAQDKNNHAPQAFKKLLLL